MQCPILPAAALPLLLLAASFGGSAAAQPAPPEPARWISRWDRGECQLIRAIGNAERLAFKATPGSGGVSIWMRALPGTARPQGPQLRARLSLSPSGATTEVASVQRYRHEGDDVYIVPLPVEPTLAMLAEARTLRLAVDDVQLIELPLGNIAGGVDVLRQCISDQLRTWGIDPVAYASLRRLPIPVHEQGLGAYLSADDYPMDPLRRNVTGSPIVRLDVGPEGRVTGCAVLQSSGDGDLDRGTCRALTRRARFRPPLDASGAETTAPYVVQVNWSIPG